MVVGYVIVLVIICMYYWKKCNGIGNSNNKKLPSFVVR